MKHASLWAAHMVIADPMSDAGPQEIARRFPKVVLIGNLSAAFNEPERQRLLIQAARRYRGSHQLIAMDTDEMMTANLLESLEWQTLPPGD